MAAKLRTYAVFFIIPGIVLAFSVLLNAAAGPYWLATNFDPSYQYLVNGVYLLKGYVPNHIDHPGTPLQMLCAAVFWFLNIGRPGEDVVMRVLAAPEFYLHAVFAVLLALGFASSLGLAVYVHRKTRDVAAGLLAQLPVLGFLVMPSFVSPEKVIPVVANVDPEPFLIVLVNVFNFCLLRDFFAVQDKRAVNDGPTIFWGAIAGLGVAVKLSFLPLLAVALLILPWRRKIVFVLSSAAAFVLGTLPICSLYPLLWQWAAGLATHTGLYGSGEQGVVTCSGFLAGLSGIIQQQPLAALLLFGALAGYCFRRAGKKADVSDAFVLATALVILLQCVLVAKHPGGHYLLPGLGLFSSLMVLVYVQWRDRHALARPFVLGAMAIAVFVAAGQAAAYQGALSGLSRDSLAFCEHIRAKYQGCVLFKYYRSSGQDEALSYSDAYQGAFRLGNELSRIYPGRYFLSRWDYRIINYRGLVWPRELLTGSACVLFQGDAGFDFGQGPLKVRLLEKGRIENVYGLTGISDIREPGPGKGRERVL